MAEMMMRDQSRAGHVLGGPGSPTDLGVADILGHLDDLLHGEVIPDRSVRRVI